MTETTTTEADRIVDDARASLDVLDNQIAQMREHKAGLSRGIAQALEKRKLYVRIIAAAVPRTRKSKANGDS